MTSIRPLKRSDLDQVASLYELVMRSGSRKAPAGLAACFARFFLDAPSRDEEIPSLVCEEPDREIVGFLGVHARKMLLDGKQIRAACSGPLVIEPKSRAKAAGIFLLKAFLNGPQDLSFTDGATEEVRRIWERLGGCASSLSCLRWTRVFRPWQFTASYLAEHPRAGPALSTFVTLSKPLVRSADALTRALPGTRFKPPDSPPAAAEEVTVKNLLEGMQSIDHQLRLRPDYDEAYLKWLFQEMRQVRSRGPLRGFLLRSEAGSVRGWYLYYLKPRGRSQVVQIAAAPLSYDSVLAHLFQDADRGGSLALVGRAEPSLLELLSRAGVTFQYRPSLALVHSKSPQIYAALFEGSALMTRLEGEWWMGFPFEPFDDV